MTNLSYKLWQDPDEPDWYYFAVSFEWNGDTYKKSGRRPSPTQCWSAAVDFMLMVCK